MQLGTLGWTIILGCSVAWARAAQAQSDSIVAESTLTEGELPTDIFGSCRAPRVWPIPEQRQGRVVLSFVIDTQGRVPRESIMLVSTTDSVWVPHAVAWARTCRYNPGRVAGKTVSVRMTRPFGFNFP